MKKIIIMLFSFLIMITNILGDEYIAHKVVYEKVYIGTAGSNVQAFTLNNNGNIEVSVPLFTAAGNINGGGNAYTNANYLQSTNYVQTGTSTNGVYSTVGSIRLGESANTNAGVWFGDDTYIFRLSPGLLSTPNIYASTAFSGPLYISAYGGDLQFRFQGADSTKRFLWQNNSNTTNFMSLTNNAGIGQLEVGNMVVTNAIYCGSVAGRVTNYLFYVSNTNWAGTWADYAGYYHGINSNNTIRITTNLWGF